MALITGATGSARAQMPFIARGAASVCIGPPHLDSCCNDEGPWGLRGVLTLADAVFSCIAVRSYIDRHVTVIERGLSSLRIKQLSKCGQLVRQAVIRVDTTDVLPDARHVIAHEVDARTTYPPDASSNAAAWAVIEVVLRAGKTSATRILPFTIRRNDLKSAG